MSALAARPVPPARAAGIITDPILKALQDASRNLTSDMLTEADASLLVLCLGPALDELEQWRHRAALVREVMAEDNVLMFPGARDDQRDAG